MSDDRTEARYSALHRLDSPASRLIRESIWPSDRDIGQQSFVGPGYLDGLAARLSIGARHRVLDVGSGVGGPAVYLAERTGCRITGVEINEVGVDASRALAASAGLEERAQFHLADALQMPVGDDTFDIAISLNVVNVFADKVVLFREVARVLRPGGIWAFLSGTFEALSAEERAGLTREGQVPIHPDSIDGYRDKVERAGFRIDEVTEYVAEFREQISLWAAAYRRHAAAIAGEQGQEAMRLHLGYFDTYERLVQAGRAANHLVIATVVAGD